MHTLVCAPANYPYHDLPAGVQRMLESAERVGIDVQLIGLGQPFHSFYRSKIRDFVPAVSQLSWDRIVMLDAGDCVFVKPLDELLRRYEQFQHPFVISTERNCYPLFHFERATPRQDLPSRYLNAGFYVAEREAWLHNMLPLMHVPGDPPCDQGVMQAAWMSGHLDVKLDYQSQLCMSLYGLDRRYPDPCVYHGNGASKNMIEGME